MAYTFNSNNNDYYYYYYCYDDDRPLRWPWKGDQTFNTNLKVSTDNHPSLFAVEKFQLTIVTMLHLIGHIFSLNKPDILYNKR